ncbi:MAG: Flp pilus assembly protein CpaB [Lentisphaerae bacterium GWF2_45_14]|nr:MAG: Flp pilus assembly protein CpaB [Lentisphaerae bacterium GWF2_45_14]
MRQKMLLLAAVFFGVLAFLLTFHQIKVEREKALGEARTVEVVVLTKDKVADEDITLNDIEPMKVKRFKSTGDRDVPWTHKNVILNQKLATSLNKGAVLQWSDFQLATKGAKGLSDFITQGDRAVSISVDVTSSVTGLISPGDNVDIIGTFRFPEMKGDKTLDTLTITILQNVKILATGTDMGKFLVKGIQKKNYSTVTLSLTPKEAEMIIFASQKGRLTLTLRNREETKIETYLQSVNFKYFEDHIKDYNNEREKRIRPGYKKKN